MVGADCLWVLIGPVVVAFAGFQAGFSAFDHGFEIGQRLLPSTQGLPEVGGHADVHVEAVDVALFKGACGGETGSQAQAEGQVDAGGIGYAGGEEVYGFSDDGVLEPVDQEAGYVVVYAERKTAQALPDVCDPVHGGVRGVFGADDFNDRDDVAGLYEVGTGNAAFVLYMLGELCDGQAGGVAGKEGFRWGEGIHLLEEGLFGFQVFGDGFYDELCSIECIFQVRGGADACQNGFGRFTVEAVVAGQVLGVSVQVFECPAEAFGASAGEDGFFAAQGQDQANLAAHESGTNNGGFVKKKGHRVGVPSGLSIPGYFIEDFSCDFEG